MTRARRWAADAPAPVFVARGGGSGLLPLALAADPRVSVVSTPRHATVLLAAGRFPGDLGDALDRVHDQMPHPRATVRWLADADDATDTGTVRNATRVPSAHGARAMDAVVEAVAAAHRDLMTGARRTEPDVLDDSPPHEFSGRGDFGQGGEGMMGGVPYGRPMAEPADDRDGLTLDCLPLTLGPFLPGFANGLRVHGEIQGGVVQRARLEVLDLGSGPRLGGGEPAAADRFRHRALWLTEALRMSGAKALSIRAARLVRSDPDPARWTRLIRMVGRSGLPVAWSNVGQIDGVDARTRLERLISDAPVEPHAPGGSVDLDRLATLLVGQDWADAVVTLWSLDLPTDRSVTTTGASR